ncbi:MAG TPA: Eco29kI family restriction endonuclease [Pyrinomonadaceae bacterium]
MVYNPLDKKNLAASVARELLAGPVSPLPPDPFTGAGVYAIYYEGIRTPYNPYTPIATAGKSGEEWVPIYVGKAIPAGARVGGLGLDAAPGNALFNRLREHAESLNQAKNLNREDFFCRYLIVDDIWIPLAESTLIQTFRPVWNTTVYGFGNHDPGGGRYKQQRSPWDVIHPGRPWADRLQPNARTEQQIVDVVRLALAPK